MRGAKNREQPLGQPVAGAGAMLDGRARGAEQRELGRDEHGVDQHDAEDDRDECADGHRRQLLTAPAPVARAGSES